MLTDTETQIVLEHCAVIKRTYPVRFLQVIPDPLCITNVRLRIGQGKWHTLHVTDAIAVTRNMLRKQRRTRLRGERTRHLRNTLDTINRHKAILGL